MNYRLLIALVSAASILVSCGGNSKIDTGGDNGGTAVASFSVSPSAISSGPEGGSYSLSVNSNVKWSTATEGAWFKISPSSGSGNASVTVTVDPNHSGARSGSISFSYAGKTNVVAVNQSEKALFLTVACTDKEFDYTGGTKTVSISSNPGWSATTSAAWLSLSATSGEASDEAVVLTVTASDNTSTERTATLTITAGDKKEEITFSQAAKPMTPFESVRKAAEGASVSVEGVTVVAKHSMGIMCYDGYEYMLVYANEMMAPIIGDKINVSGKKALYAGMSQIQEPTVQIVGSGVSFTYPEPDEMSSSASHFLSFRNIVVPTFVTVQGTLVQNGAYNNIKIDGLDSQDASIAYYPNSEEISGFSGAIIQVTGFYLGISGGTHYNIMAVDVKKIADIDNGYTYSSVPAWMELPAVTDASKFHIHTVYDSGKYSRNYSFIYDSDNLVANWVAYPLNDWYTESNTGRSEYWYKDPYVDIQAILAKSGAFYTNGYERGHQIGSADRLRSRNFNDQTFYYTNATPQLGGDKFNSGVWGDLENQVRRWSKASNSTDTLYVVTGCMVKKGDPTVNDNDGKPVTIPSAYFKALLRYSSGSTNQYIGAGFYVEHKDYSSGSKPSLKSCAMPIKDLEEKTGFNFFVNLPADKSAAIKAEDPTGNSFWNLK